MSWTRLRRFPCNSEVINPELAANRAARRQSADVQHHQLAIWPCRELAGYRFPESRVFQFIAFVINRLGIHVLNGEMRSTRAFNVPVLVVTRKLISSVGLDGN